MLPIHAAIIVALHLPAVSTRRRRVLLRRACYGRKPLLRSASPAEALLACCCGGSFRGRSMRRACYGGFAIVGGCRPRTPAYRCARLLLRKPLLRSPPPNPRLSLRSASPAEGFLPRTIALLACCCGGFAVVGGCRPRTPAYRCARLLLRKASFRGRSLCSRAAVEGLL